MWSDWILGMWFVLISRYNWSALAILRLRSLYIVLMRCLFTFGSSLAGSFYKIECHSLKEKINLKGYIFCLIDWSIFLWIFLKLNFLRERKENRREENKKYFHRITIISSNFQKKYSIFSISNAWYTNFKKKRIKY